MTNICEPSREELRQLPLRAIVAFVARQARVVAPHFEILGDDPEVKITQADLERAVAFCERAGHAEPVSTEEARLALAVSDALFPAAMTETDVEVGNIIRKAVLAATSAMSQPTDKVAVANFAADACIFTDDLPDPEELTQAAREEFEALLTAAQRDGWTDDTPVAPEFFEVRA
jgi:hypothetical protein